MNLSDIKALLKEHDLQLTRSLGQCFMHDENVIRKMVQLAGVGPGEKILEIGPGLGPLTEHLLAAEAEVTAVEIDRRLGSILAGRFGDDPHLKLVEADALKWLRKEAHDFGGWKLVANLPYSVASPILVELAAPGRAPAAMVFTVQSEVAERLAAKSGSRDYGVLSLLIQAAYDVRELFRIPPECFFPAPRIDSACARLVRKAAPPVTAERYGAFKALVKLAFSQRRKKMLKVLKGRWPESDLVPALRQAEIDLSARAETVTLEQFLELNRLLNFTA